MKQLLLIFVCFLIAISCLGQRNHSFAVGIDYIKNSQPKEWNGKDFRTKFTPNSLFHGINGDCGIWLAYYYKNLYSMKLGLNSYALSARADRYENTPEGIILERQVEIYEMQVGYNFNQFYSNLTRSTFLKKIDSWLYLGAAYMGNGTWQSRFMYNPQGAPWERLRITHTDTYNNKIRPVAQVMIKYNPIRYVFVAAGGTYRYIAKDFQPFSLNISAGLQL